MHISCSLPLVLIIEPNIDEQPPMPSATLLPISVLVDNKPYIYFLYGQELDGPTLIILYLTLGKFNATDSLAILD